MDPADYATHSLPKIEYYEKRPAKSYALGTEEYGEFLKEFQMYIGGDCHAITLNDEIIYNTYENKSVREILQDGLIRDKIIENPHSLFVNIIRKSENARVIVYMFGKTPWFLATYYNSVMKMITLEYYNSQIYLNTFPE